MRFPAVTLTLLLLGGASAPAQLSDEKLKDVTRYLQSEVDSKHVAGAIGLISHQGKIGYFESVGDGIQADSLFRIASMTKAVTSVAVMALVEDGKIALEDPVENYLPGFSNPQVYSEGENTTAAEQKPTLHHLLTHTSGIGYGWFGPEAQDAAYQGARVSDLLVPADETIAERVEKLAPLPLAFEPGTQWSYGLSVDVLGRVVEVVSGLTLEQFFQERIFGPLGMQDTHFYLPKDKLTRLAPLYTPNESKSDLIPVGSEILEAGPIKYSADYCYEGKGKLFAGGSGLVSSTGDYAKFLQMLIGGGKPVLKNETVQKMTENKIGDLTIPFPGHGDGFGYGFGVLTERGKSEDVAGVGTYSWGGIFNTYYWVDPEEEMFGILMTQVFPNDHLTIRKDFKKLAYDAIEDAQSSAKVPAGFKAITLVDNINAATSLVTAPDGRVFYAEQTGAIRVVKNGKLLPTPAIDLSAKLDTWWERGLIGITLHPDFPRTPYLFAVYVAKEPFTHHVVSRFTVVGDTLDATSELVLLEGDDQATLGGFQPAGHQGGALCFGQDGMLYIGLGEQTAGEPSQHLDSLLGKILRLRQDGSIPEDNPYFEKTEGKYRSVYAIGIRNPFGLALEPTSGKLFEADVGASAFEEINEIRAGENYGWPKAEGMSDNEKFTNPIHAYPPAIGRSICGAMFYPSSGNFPDKWHGKLFIADWANHWLRAIDLDAPEKLIPFGEGFSAPVGISSAPDGSIYVLNRNTRWRDGDVFKEKTGSLVQIRYVGESEAPAPEASSPETLAEVGVFKDLSNLVPIDGFHPFKLNAERWQPGITTRRWISVPQGKTVQTSASEHWEFPEGTIILQHFDTASGQRHETHVYQALGNGSFDASAYRWDAEVIAATLVPHSEIIDLPGSDGLKWFSPGAEKGLRPELSVAGFVLQLNARQLHCGDQLAAWKKRGWIDSIGDWPQLASLEDTSVPLGHRVRSYLDSNCASCHRPGGPSRGLFDARFTTAFADQGILGGDLMAGDLGIAGAKLLIPGSPEKSILYQRTERQDAYRMPPISVNTVASPVLPLMKQWISEMKATVSLTEDAIDESAGNLPAYKIETPNATYYLEKSGAGLSSIIDVDGNDWLGFHPKPGSGAAGEYRGFPNAVHQQAGNYFHAKNQGTDLSTTKVTRNEPGYVTITAEGDNGKWACRYDFTSTHCTFTMTKMPEGWKYWTLYEGTPGGGYNDTDWWMTSSIQEKQPLTKTHEGDIPSPEWIAFGDPRMKRSLYLFHHEDDEHPDRFYQMEHKMTVFGFGRQGIDKFLDSVPQSISIGILETDAHAAISAAIMKSSTGHSR